jgi:hypothetical protein
MDKALPGCAERKSPTKARIRGQANYWYTHPHLCIVKAAQIYTECHSIYYTEPGHDRQKGRDFSSTWTSRKNQWSSVNLKKDGNAFLKYNSLEHKLTYIPVSALSPWSSSFGFFLLSGGKNAERLPAN